VRKCPYVYTIDIDIDIDRDRDIDIDIVFMFIHIVFTYAIHTTGTADDAQAPASDIPTGTYSIVREHIL
jgi:hypothetical protein